LARFSRQWPARTTSPAPRSFKTGRLGHDPEKRNPVFRKDHAQTKS
jgi:hypothetical protein